MDNIQNCDSKNDYDLQSQVYLLYARMWKLVSI
jgi:hypothetical protein